MDIKNDGNKKKQILIALVALLAIVVFFVFIKPQNKEDKNTETELSSHLNKDQMEIFSKIYNAKQMPGAYTYEVSLDKKSVGNIVVYTSGDNRMLSVGNNDNGILNIYDEKYLYNKKKKNKTFYKKESDYKLNSENKLYLDYYYFFNSTEDTLIDGLSVGKDGDNYIIKNNAISYSFDKNYIMIEGETKSADGDSLIKLIDYDKDFDKYYNEYFEKMKTYEEVDDVNKVSPKY